jgi:hypothetical protein
LDGALGADIASRCAATSRAEGFFKAKNHYLLFDPSRFAAQRHDALTKRAEFCARLVKAKGAYLTGAEPTYAFVQFDRRTIGTLPFDAGSI